MKKNSIEDSWTPYLAAIATPDEAIKDIQAKQNQKAAKSNKNQYWRTWLGKSEIDEEKKIEERQAIEAIYKRLSKQK